MNLYKGNNLTILHKIIMPSLKAIGPSIGVLFTTEDTEVKIIGKYSPIYQQQYQS